MRLGDVRPVVPPLNRAVRAPLGKRQALGPRGCSRPNIPNADNPSAKAGTALPALPSKRRYCNEKPAHRN